MQWSRSSLQTISTSLRSEWCPVKGEARRRRVGAEAQNSALIVVSHTYHVNEEISKHNNTASATGMSSGYL